MYHTCPIRCITDPIFFQILPLGTLSNGFRSDINISINLMNHARCRQYIAMHFGEEAAENVLVYEDFSGGNLERPQFKKMMKDSQKIAFAAIVVYRLDRISRNIGDFAERTEFEGEHGIMVYNRSLQRPGKANQIRPMEEWIVAVGKHPGIIFLCQPPGQIRFPAAADDAELHIRPSLPVSAHPGTRKDTAELCRVFLHILFPMRRLSPPCS